MKKMRKTFIIAVCTMLLLSCSIGLFRENPRKTVARELGLDVDNGYIMRQMDTHGGFLGDGCSYIEIGFRDQGIEDQVKGNTSWKKMPLDDTARTLVELIQDEDGNPLIPECTHGYYIIMDWQDETDIPMLDRYSFNYTVGLYDSDGRILHYGRFDT